MHKHTTSLLIGYEDVVSLTLLSDEEIQELAISLKMKPGHMKKLPFAIEKARDEMGKYQERRKREEDEKLEELEVKRKLAGIDRELKLKEARSKRDQPEENTLKKTAEATAKSGETGTLVEGSAPLLPFGKRFHYFA
jgi:hypothetical protein